MRMPSRDLLKSVGRICLFVLLLALPVLGRGAYYYRRIYAPPPVALPDHSAVDMPIAEPVAFADRDVRLGKGRVLVDRAHDNAVDDDELNVLLSRLTARGMEVLSLLPDEPMADALRAAASLVVVSPHLSFSAQEVEAVRRFVEQGGRVLLAGDPSRYSVDVAYDEVFGEYLIPASDVTAINSLASAMGLAFSDDYIYSTAENAGNYQYVRLRDFVESPLTAGLEEVVFYAAHSIAQGETALITGDSQTTSSLSEQTGGLVTVSLGGGGQVLAVGDFTFMTEPYNATADNNRLIANIADFVAAASRTYGLVEFPHFFGDEVEMVPLVVTAEELALSGALVDEFSTLQSALGSANRILRWRAIPDLERDTIYLGFYGGLWRSPEVSGIMAAQGISFTLETAEQQRAALTPAPSATPTPRHTPTPTSTVSPPPTPTPTVRPLRDWIHIEGVGAVDARENALFYHNEEGGRQVLVVLAFSEEGLASATRRLIDGDFAGCLMEQDRVADPDAASVALCPTAYEPSEEDLTPEPTPTPESEDGDTVIPELEGSVLIVADDDGEGTLDWWTSAYQFYDIVIEEGHEPDVWSTGLDGEVDPGKMQSYSVVVWCTGDYQAEGGNPSGDELDMLQAYLEGGGRVILSGAFLGDPEARESGLLLDVQVSQADHPLASGFEADQVLELQRFTAEEDYSPYLLSDLGTGDAVFVRGPGSEFAGEAIVFAQADELDGGKMVVIGFPIYLLEYDLGFQLGQNAFRWAVE